MGASKKELHDLLEDSLVMLRELANKHHGDMDDLELLKLMSTIVEIERTI